MKTISAGVLKKRGHMTPTSLSQLVVRNMGEDLSTRLTEFGVRLEEGAVVTPVVSLRPENGRVASSRLAVRGEVFRARSLPAREIWPQVREDLQVAFTINGTILAFNSREGPNVSDWVELDRLPSFSVTRPSEEEGLPPQIMTREERNQEEGVKEGVCGRVVIQHKSVDSADIFLHIFPGNLETVRELAGVWNLPTNSHQLPGVPIYSFYTRNARSLKAKTIQWGLREQQGENIGFGIFPAIEVPAAELQVPLNREVIEREMIALLRRFTGTLAVKLGDIETILAAEERPDTGLETRALTWPRYREIPEAPAPSPAPSGAAQTPRPAPSASAPPASAPPATAPHISGKRSGSKAVGGTRGGKGVVMRPTSVGKYSHEHGLFSQSSLDREMGEIRMPEDLAREFVNQANASLAYQTWRGVRSVARRIRECQVQTGVDLSFPWQSGHLNVFSAWCLKRGLREKTIAVYISKVRREGGPDSRPISFKILLDPIVPGWG